MRKDMQKKLVDTHRVGGGRNRRSGKGGRCKNPEVMRDRRARIELEEITDEETGETYLDLAEGSVSSRGAGARPKGWDRKEFGENLNPLWRYLQKQVGRNWDTVYSEICENMDRRSAVGGHIFEHLFDFVVVAKMVRIVDRVPYLVNPYSGNLEPITYKGAVGEWRCFYVDPRDNKLKCGVAPDESGWNKNAREKRRDREDRLRSLGGGVWMSRHPKTDLWYRLVAVDQEYTYEEVRYQRPKYGIDGRFLRDDNDNIVYEFLAKTEKREVYTSDSIPAGLFVPKGKVVISCRSASKKDLKAI